MSRHIGPRQLEKLDKFFEDNEDILLVAPGKENELPPCKYLWDGDYDDVWKELLKVDELEPRHHCYTLIEAEGKTYIIGGWHYVNRLGYFISKEKVDMKLNLRYA